MPVRKMLALGDSVMWGQGLAEPHKFVRLVQAALGQRGQTVELASLAHSGAIIDLAPALPTPTTSLLFGELPRTYPGILSELATAAGTAGFGAYLQPNSWDRRVWRDVKADAARQIAGYADAPPGLILVDGGANDFKALQIVLPWNLRAGADGGPSAAVERVVAAVRAAGSAEAAVLPDLPWLTEQEFKELIDQFLFQRMRALLARLGPAFPQSRVVVTGYYPIFTAGSLEALTALADPAVALLFARADSAEEQLAALAWALQPGFDRAAFVNRILLQSRIWAEHGTARLREAVAEANQTFGDRFALASPAFGPDNGALAPDSLLWSFTPAADAVLRELVRLLGGAAAAPVPEAEVTLGLGAALEFTAGYGLGAGLATDEATGARALSAFRYYVQSGTGREDPATSLFGGFTTAAASAGHPNPAGARAFAAVIEPLV